ncbi:MAG: UDP-N-acetylmuramoyl-L-alanine--D-glutamate ligase [Deferribacteraceae bacterium]|jgi:UDP-N-acetylmuramoylalanine--D-glutamate ligase|nr:UDP-N-acetylmuramoyl-L-alanine--D-glutamate ligase [Deferribacteraceae bacterium]
MYEKTAIIGYGKSGAGAERILKLRGCGQPDLYDDANPCCKPIAEYKDIYELTVVSPGVPFSKLPEKPSVYTSEIELAYGWMPADSKVIGITGTNGKSTVTHLTAQILNNLGHNAISCGNIGYTFADAVAEIVEPAIFVVELSSFQTELLQDFSMQATAVTNITPDHLDRYATVEDYVNAKLALLSFIDSEGVLIADPDVRITNRVLKAVYKVRYMDREYRAWPKLAGNIMNFGNFYADIRKFELFGAHNLLNLAFALSLADAVTPMEGDVTQYICGLTGLPHRTEVVPTDNGIRWINDSKATNVDSTLTALKSCVDPTIVFLGGRDKKGDFTQLTDELERCASVVCLFGEAAPIISSQLTNKLNRPVKIFRTLRNAVEEAVALAKPGCTVILSPGCASYDEFLNYEDRGHKFAEYIKDAYNV